jgi:hypothetical protein
MRLTLCVLLSLAFFSPPPKRLGNPQEPKISVDVQLVTVLASVQNKHGEIARNLTKDDFILEQDGHPQAIQYFKQEADLPLTLGLLVDTSLSQRLVLGEERSASYSFLDHVLREDKDRAFVIHFDREVELLQDLTSSRKQLESSLALLEEPERDSGNSSGGGSGSRGRGSRGGAGTLLYDAVYLASNELMKKQQGRKAIIILSDGVDHGSKESLDTAIESAQRADTLVYSILFGGEEGGGGSGHPHFGGMGPYGGGGGGGPAGFPNRIIQTARRFSSGSRRKQVAIFLRFPRSRRSIRSTPALNRNYAINTAWDTTPRAPTQRRAITRSASRLSRKT